MMITQSRAAGLPPARTSKCRILRRPGSPVCVRRRPPAPIILVSAPAGMSPDEATRYSPLVRQVAYEIRRNLPAQVELDDLTGDGTVGLLEAAVKYDAAKRVSFKAYARYRIRGAIVDGLRREDRASRGLRRKIKQAESAGHRLEARLGRPATSEEVARELGISLDAWHKTAAEADRATQVPTPFLENLEERPSPWPAASDADPFERCYRAEQQRVLESALGCLDDRERRMIRLYYFESQTMQQIGKSLGVDESRISQLHARALQRLRQCVGAMLAHGRASAAPERPRAAQAA